LISANVWKCLDQLFIDLITQVMVVEECKSWHPHYADWPPSSAILRRSGAVLLFLLYAFMTWTGMTSTFYVINAVLFFFFYYLLPCKSSYLSQYPVKTC
jgi:hypothetical protein